MRTTAHRSRPDRSGQDAISGSRAERVLIAGGFDQAFMAYWQEGTVQRRDAVRLARQEYARLRTTQGYQGSARVLTPGESQYKLRKNDTDTYGLMLLPATSLMGDEHEGVRQAAGLTGAWNLCPRSSPGCRAAHRAFSRA